MSNDKSKSIVLDVLLSNVESFERIYENSWIKKEELAKQCISLSSSFLVFTISVAAFLIDGGKTEGLDFSKFWNAWLFLLHLLLAP